MTISANYPTVRPTLSLDFAKTKVLDPRITFTRSTTATYYDGITSAVAEQNLVKYSQGAFSNSTYWTTSDAPSITVTDNSVAAPDGTTTASTVPFTTQFQGVRTATANFIVTSGLQYTASIYVYVASGTKVFSITGATSGTVYGTYTATTSWARYSLTFTASVSESVYIIQDRNASGFVTAYIWGAQLEQRSSVTAYTATTTTAITNYIPVLQTASSNIPRFDNNPTTGESLGLLIEQQSTNLLIYSSDFSNGNWSKTSVTVNTAADIAPDGTQTAQWLVGTAAGERAVQSLVVATTSCAFSVYVKATSYAGTWTSLGATLLLRNTTTLTNLVSATFSGNTFTPSAGGTATSIGNGWYRISIIASSGITIGDGIACYLYTDNTQGASTSSSLFAWGAQLEALAFPTSYIPTVASQVTRSADSASMTGTNFSSWFNAGQGTFYSEFARINASIYGGYPALFTTESLLAFSDGTYENLKNIVANNQISIASSGTSQKKVAYIYSQAIGYAFLINASTSTTSNTSQVSSAISINFNPAGNQTSIRIKKFSYYPVAVTTAQLQALTGS
jgi:hypothetical protein